MARLAVLAVAFGLLAAGCLSGGTDTAEPAAQPDTDNATANTSTLAPANDTAGLASAEAPHWQEGQWFAYDRQGTWTEGTPGEVRLVVTQAHGSGYRTGLSDRDALAVDLFWFNHPLLGPLDADLASQLPAEGNPPPQVLDWPLEDGKAWETTGYGDDWTVEAETVDEVDTPAGPAPGYAITANGTLAEAIEATYVPQLGTLVSYAVDWDGDGEPEYQLDLVDAGTDHDGDLWTGEPHAILHDAWTAEGLAPPQQAVDVPEPATDLYASVSVSAPTGGSLASLTDPGNAERHRAVATPGSPATELVALEDPASGSWTWNLATTGTEQCGQAPAGAGCGGIFVRTVALEIQDAG